MSLLNVKEREDGGEWIEDEKIRLPLPHVPKLLLFLGVDILGPLRHQPRGLAKFLRVFLDLPLALVHAFYARGGGT